MCGMRLYTKILNLLKRNKMNNERFNNIVDNRVEKCKELLLKKSKEYSRLYHKVPDRLSNFKRAGEWDEEPPERALWGMWKKQLISLRDFINDLENDVIAPWEQWEEKLGDSHNYLYLLEALVRERKELELVESEREVSREDNQYAI